MWRCIAVLGFSLIGMGCQAEVGQRCDGFFTNQCRSPASCVDGPDGSYCATSCSMRAIPEPGQERYYCEDESLQPVEVKLDNGSSMGCHCFPKAGAK